MADEDWVRSEELFHELIGLSSAARGVRLAQLAAGNQRLAAELEDLLAADGADETVIEHIGPAVEALLHAPDLEEGATFGRFRITGRIGRGGMGRVYRAVRDDTRQTFAIKVLDRMLGIDEIDRERFTREQRTLARLNHAGIAHLYDADAFADGTPWFAMEYVAGGVAITDYCRHRDLDVSQRLRLFEDVCRAVRHAHGHAIIHRDSKPSNVLVGEDGVVKVVDFGIARDAAGADTERDRQAAAQTLTPAAAAPEQLSGDPVGFSADLYALGNLLFELLTDRKLFDLDGLPVADIRRIVVEETPPAPSSIRPGVRHRLDRMAWRELDAMCLRLLRKAPQERGSIDVLVIDLERFHSGRPVPAYGDAASYRLRKFARRHAVAVAGVAASLVVVSGLVAASTVGLARERRATLDEARRTARLQQFMLGLFTGEQPEVGPARDLTVKMLLERGVLAADALADEPDIRAELWQTLGTMFGQLGDLDRADTLLTRSLEDRTRRLPPRDPLVIEALVMQSLLRTDQADYIDGERLARDAITRLDGVLAPAHPVAIRAQAALGKALTGRGAYTDAIAVLAPVVDGRRGGASSAEWAGALNALANARQYAGELPAADRLNRLALDADRRVYGNFHPDVADDLINLGGTAQTRGEYAAAEQMKREALGIFEGWYGPDHPETGSAALSLAQAISSQGRFDEAASLLEKARRAFEQAYKEPHRRLGLVHHEMGGLALRRGRYDDAIASQTQALTIYRKVYRDGRSQYISAALANLGIAYLEKGELADAERLLREAVTLSRSVLGPNHANTASAEVRLGRALVRRERFAEALAFIEGGRATLGRIAPSSDWLAWSAEDVAAARAGLSRAGRSD